MSVMRDYDSALGADQWCRYALGDPSRGYTRNGVDECDGKASLLILVWNPGKGSTVHSHGNAHCILKVLSGTLTETLYEWPAGDSIGSGADGGGACLAMNNNSTSESKEKPGNLYLQTSSMKNEKVTTLNTGDLSYMTDSIGLHRIVNPSLTEVAVSLHLYTPPYVAKYGCFIFEEQTGRKHHVTMSNLYSNKGIVLHPKNAHSC